MGDEEDVFITLTQGNHPDKSKADWQGLGTNL